MYATISSCKLNRQPQTANPLRAPLPHLAPRASLPHPHLAPHASLPPSHPAPRSRTSRPRAIPGKYTARFTINGKAFTQPFEIWRDPTMPASDADLAASFGLQRRIITAMNELADRINRIEIMRMQVEDLRKAHGSDPTLDQALAALYKKMYDAELHFLTRTEMHTDDKWYVEKYEVYFNLIWLLAEIGGGGGDVMGGAGFAPTNAAQAVYEDRLKDVQAARSAFTGLMAEVEAFNTMYAGKLPAISDQLPAGSETLTIRSS